MDSDTIDLPVLRPSDSDWTTSPATLVLQFADGRSQEFLASITTWVNSYNKPLMCILLVMFLWRNLTSTECNSILGKSINGVSMWIQGLAVWEFIDVLAVDNTLWFFCFLFFFWSKFEGCLCLISISSKIPKFTTLGITT